MDKDLKHVLDYFAFFSYSPSLEHIYMFYPRRISYTSLKKRLDTYVHAHKLLSFRNSMQKYTCLEYLDSLKHDLKSTEYYTLPQYSIRHHKNQKNRNADYLSQKLASIQLYIRVMQYIPSVRFVGLTGSSAMIHTGKHGDIDLCIVTAKDQLWTTRLILVVIGKLLGMYGSKACLNLFFDESDLRIAKEKQNTYVAHELLQLVPIIDKGNIHSCFFRSNQWVKRYFPNTLHLFTSRHLKKNTKNSAYLPYWIELIAKTIQKPIIHRNKTGLKVTATQLWLFKSDFEKKLHAASLV